MTAWLLRVAGTVGAMHAAARLHLGLEEATGDDDRATSQAFALAAVSHGVKLCPSEAPAF